MKSIKTVFIAGPTASGKTALGAALAKKFGGEVVSADSMQIYMGIHIASAAPDSDEALGVPHHMLEFLEPEQSFSVADYVNKARTVIKDINARGKLPFVVGGTGLYISSLAYNTVYADEPTDLDLRKELNTLFDQEGAEKMLERLSEFDPESAARLHPNNRRRIIRAFEVYRLTGHSITEQNILSKEGEKYIEPLLIGITYRDREKLYERINRRVDIMLENGLEGEARAALSRSSGGAVQAIGHKELAGYINGECSLSEAVESLKRQTRRYAKRQLTWFNRDKRINWIYVDECPDPAGDAEKLIKKFIGTEERI